MLNQGHLTSDICGLRASAAGETGVHIAMVGRSGDTGFPDEEDPPMDSRHLQHSLPAFLDRGGCLGKTRLHTCLLSIYCYFTGELAHLCTQMYASAYMSKHSWTRK